MSVGPRRSKRMVNEPKSAEKGQKEKIKRQERREREKG